jgi:hypothetical protein
VTEPTSRSTPLEKAWQNLLIRTTAYYVLLLGAGAALWRWAPERMGALTRDLSGDATPAAFGRGALEDALTQPLFGTAGSGDMVSATVAMVVAGLFALPVAWVYILIRRKKGYRQSLVHSLVMLPVVVAGVVVLVKNSLALAFSLAGIVAAVRFRNTLEDSKDAVYIFVATGIGLAAGVDLSVAVALSVIFNLVAVALWYSDLGRASASLEGAAARRRLRQALAHANRPSGLVQRLDDEVLEAMSAEQLDALAQRAWRRRRHASEEEVERFDALLLIRATDVDGARRAMERLLTERAKRWAFAGVVHEADGTHLLEYGVQLKKNTASAEFVAALQAEGGSAVTEVELR